MNVLIVDDEPTTRTLLRRAVSRTPALTIYEANDGLAALAELSKRPFGVVIMDLEMPTLGGIEVLESIRGYPQLADVAVVLMSATRSEATVRRAIELGISAYLTKPLDAARVHARLAPVFQLAQQQAVPPAVDAVDGIDPEAAFMVVDGSADFRHFFVSTFSTDRPVRQAASGVEALVEARREWPAVIFIGTDLGPLGGALLVRKLREHANAPRTTLVAVRARHGGVDIPGVDATVLRTFVVEAFRSQVDRLLGPPRPSGGELIGRPSLRLQAASACEQVFGMMLDIEVEPGDDTIPVAAGAVAATQAIEWADGGERLLFTLYLDEPSAARVAAALLKLSAEELDAELIESACAEMSNIITGRLKTTYEAGGTSVVCGLPETRRTAADVTPHGQRNTVTVACRTLAGDLTCVLTIAAVAPAPAADASAA